MRRRQSAVHLAQMGARVTAVDFSKAQLDHARAFARSKKAAVRLPEVDAQDLSMLDDPSFDVAFSAYALGFVEDIQSTFREVARVLRAGGVFAFSWMSPLYAITEERGLLVKRSYGHRRTRAVAARKHVLRRVPLSKIRVIPGTTIWRARKPAA